jgi:hypothetical protein
MIDRPDQRLAAGDQVGHVRFAVVPPVDGERRPPLPQVQMRGGERRQRLSHHFHAPRHHPVCVLAHQFDLFRFDGIIIDQVIPQPRAAVIV